MWEAFKASSGVKKTCSVECANERKNALRRRGVKERNCIVCGKAFKTNSGVKKTCSPECAASRMRTQLKQARWQRKRLE